MTRDVWLRVTLVVVLCAIFQLVWVLLWAWIRWHQ